MRSIFLQSVAVLVVAAVMLSPTPATADVYNLRLQTDNGPDFTDLESLVRTATGHLQTPQEKCIAVWRWGRRSRRQTSNATEDGRLVWDPILHYNSYGAMNCGVISGLNVACFLQLGYKARYVQLGDHTVCEVSWDDGRTWHLFDSSMSFFCYNHDGAVAGCEEIKQAAACELSGGRKEPGHYYFYHGAPQCRSHLGPDAWRSASDQPVAYQRTLANGASSYTDGFSPDKYTLHARFGRRYVLNLRRHESYSRHWRPLDRDLPDLDETRRPDFYRPVKGKDPDEHHDLHNLRGNGVWRFAPDLAAADCRTLLYDFANLKPRADGAGPNLHLNVCPDQPNEIASAVWKVSAANVITSMQIEAKGLRSAESDRLRILVSRHAGIDWTEVWQSEQTGRQSIRLRLRDEVAGVTECLVKVEMLAAAATAGVGLDSLALTTTTQLNRRTLPKLTRGSNRVRLSADQQVDTTVLWPSLHDGRFRQTVHQSQDVHSAEKPDGMYKATLGAGVDGRECSASWRVEVPTAITGVTYGAIVTNRSPASSVTLRHSFDGTRFEEFYRKADGDAPFDKQVVHTVAADASTDARAAFLQTAFSCRSNAATYNMPGIQDTWIRVNHRPRDARFRPVEITYKWTEHRTSGDVVRTHTELVEKLPHEYTVNVAGFRDPTMHSVRLNQRGYGPQGDDGGYGYSDGKDVGGDHEPRAVLYRWGQNLALDKPYTADRPSSEASGNPDQVGRELTNGKIIAPTDIATSRMVQEATAFWDPGEPLRLVVDLGRRQSIGGVRVSTHQPGPKYGHPQQVDVAVSDDGTNWRPAGTIRHRDLWNPPADYEPWEHDDDPRYADLPAAGRLAYSFPLVFDKPATGRYVRFVCTPLDGCGMGLSQLEVFDTATVTPAPPLVAW